MAKLNFSRQFFISTGFLPLRSHYYEPFDKHIINQYKNRIRNLDWIDFNIDEQINLLKKFSFNDELEMIPYEKSGSLKYYYKNDFFVPGDAEIYYSIIRHFKPSKIIEIGSGLSTLLALDAINKNKTYNKDYNCQLTCIEPFESKWLKDLPVNYIKSKVEKLNCELFSNLNENDILFIDSSHIIKPGGDMLFEFFTILPSLKKGVLIHFHDIFTPYDYPENWVKKDFRFWNEMYLLEAFLYNNTDFKIVLALNYLKHNYFDILADKCPALKKFPGNEPGSFWLRKIN